MKKKIIFFSAMLCLVGATTACGLKDGGNVKLGAYKGIEAEYVEQSIEVSDEEVDAAIQEDLKAAAEKTEDKKYQVKEGDTVNIDYKGLKDGEAFENGTAEGADLEIGSDSFIDGFEEGLVGAVIGEKRKLNLTFPEDYKTKELAGQDVVFKVTVNSITVIPELTDEFVKANQKEYQNVAEYKAGVRAKLEEQAKTNLENTKADAAWEVVIEKSSVKKYPQDQIDEVKKDMEEWYTDYATYYGLELDAFIEQMGSTKDEFNKEMENGAQKEVAERLIIEEIAKKEKLEISDEEYKAGLARYTETYGYETEEEFLKDADEASIRRELLKEKVQKIVLENATLKAITQEEADAKAAAKATTAPTENAEATAESTTQE